MNDSVRNNRLAIRRLVASAGGANPRIHQGLPGRAVEILIDPRPGIAVAGLQKLQNDLEEILGATVVVMTPGDLSARTRAFALKNAQPI